jgi:hypothetical protein
MLQACVFRRAIPLWGQFSDKTSRAIGVARRAASPTRGGAIEAMIETEVTDGRVEGLLPPPYWEAPVLAALRLRVVPARTRLPRRSASLPAVRRLGRDGAGCGATPARRRDPAAEALRLELRQRLSRLPVAMRNKP